MGKKRWQKNAPQYGMQGEDGISDERWAELKAELNAELKAEFKPSSPAAPAPAPTSTVAASSVVRAVAPARALAPAPVGPARFSGEAFLTHCEQRVGELNFREYSPEVAGVIRRAVLNVLRSEAMKAAVDQPGFVEKFPKMMVREFIQGASWDPTLAGVVFDSPQKDPDRPTLKPGIFKVMNSAFSRWLGQSYCYPHGPGLEEVCRALRTNGTLREPCFLRCINNDVLCYSYIAALPKEQPLSIKVSKVSSEMKEVLISMLNAEDNGTYFASPEALKQAFFERLSARIPSVEDEQLKLLAGYIDYALERAYVEVTRELSGRWQMKAAAQPQNGACASR